MSGENPYASHQVAATSHYSLQVPHTPASAFHPVTPEGTPLSGHPPLDYREDLNGQFGGNNFRSDTMNGVVNHRRPHQQFPYGHGATPQVRRQSESIPQWQGQYYAGQIPIPIPEGDFVRRNSAREVVSNSQAPFSPQFMHGSQWEKIPGYSHPSPQQQHAHDSTFAHPPNPAPQTPTYNSNTINQNFVRPPPHRPVEPNAAPSPPTQYPTSPRTPIPAHQITNTNGMSATQQFRQPNPRRPPLSVSTGNSEPLDHRNDSVSSQNGHLPKHPSLSPTSITHRVNGSRGSVGQPPLSAGSANGAPLAFPESGQHRAPVYDGNPHRNSFGSNSRVGGEDENGKTIENPMVQNGLGNSFEPAGEERPVKREARSRSGSPSRENMRGSPQPPGSAKKAKLEGGEPPPKKKGQPVFRDEKGNEYYENEPVPDGVKIPTDWQIGTGKMTKGLLLPKMKDGIQVNPEWGFTAGGKARQRLPQACVNCRQKKIRCVESDYDETICSHCMKMRIVCERHIKDEEKKKKKTKSENGVGRSASIASDNGMIDSSLMQPRSKKRKQSEDIASGKMMKTNKRTMSRGGSISTEQPFNNSGSAMSGMSHSAPSGSSTSDNNSKPAPFPTMDEGGMTVATMQTDEDPMQSRNRYLQELRDQRTQFGSQFGSQYGSLADSSPISSYASASPTSQAFPHHQTNTGFIEPPKEYASSSNSKNSGNSNSTPVTLTGTPPISSSILHTLGEDPRHPDLPAPGLLNHLVETYFTNVYSQTYAFLHKPTFFEKEAMETHPPVLLFSICAVAARFSRVSTQEEKFAKKARALIMENYDSYTIEVVQSMVNMGLHDFGSNNGHKAWMFAGMAVRMGAAMNLNLENKKKGKSRGAVSREVARRTYWSYYLMDRFNSYGVARPYLTQDHDCHIQLPCNQPSFISGDLVVTEHLLGANPNDRECGNRYMGAMAYLVRIVSIWGNVLKQIHLSGFSFDKRADVKTTKKARNSDFGHFVNLLEEWRKSLPPGLQYSNENLAGQIKVGTTGAFVMMHVMWHTAMAYVHRYVRTVGIPKSYVEENIPKGYIVESIRKAFVHADAVLQIMYHVHQKKISMARDPEAGPITVNAPFLGQAISDACNITVIRAVEVRGEPSGAEDQRIRVLCGLEWLKGLGRYWKPLEAMYKRLKRTCKNLDKSMSVPPITRIIQENNNQCCIHVAPTPESTTTDTPVIPQQQEYHFPVDPSTYAAEPTYTSGPMDTSTETVPLNSTFTNVADFLGVGNVPDYYFGEAFTGNYSRHALFHIATAEFGFPELYQYENMDLDQMEINMASVSASFDDSMGAVSLGPGHIQQEMHPGLPVVTQPVQVNYDSHPHICQQPECQRQQSEPKIAPSDVDVFEPADSDDDDGSDDGSDAGSEAGSNGDRNLESPGKDLNERRDIHALYFDPVAVHDGKLQDSASETSGHSRRPSEAASKHNGNPMDLFNFINGQVQGLRDALPNDHKDEFTGPGGAAAPATSELNENHTISLDNQAAPDPPNDDSGGEG